MASILTPLSIWNNLDGSLELRTQLLGTEVVGNTVFERLTFYGRMTAKGRVKIAAEFAYDKRNPAEETVLVLSDSKDTIDRSLMTLFVERGYSVLMVDYRGEWDGCDFYTVYPEDIAYANFKKCGRSVDFVDETADKTSWYEWVAVGIYARKYITHRTGNKKIAVVGLRDGGEIAWKLGTAAEFSCIIPVSAAGWRAYHGISKYLSVEPELNDERYRFIAGIDSQAYAPYVKCPVLMLCSTNDPRFDYDRAYDTFSRVNSEFAAVSAIGYSVNCNCCIGVKSTFDMFLFLDKNLKNRQVFIPKPPEITVEVDEGANLIARAEFDDQGVPESFELYLAEDCIDSGLREWNKCPVKRAISPTEQEFFLNIYEKTSTIFVLLFVKYSNGFTVWSKTVVKKISGKFRNMQPKCRVMYSDKDGTSGFSIADFTQTAVGGMFFLDAITLPQVVEKAKGVKGIYSSCGLTTFRMNNPRYSPTNGSILKLDLFCDKTATVRVNLHDINSGEDFETEIEIIGGVWQTVVAESKLFKNANGVALATFTPNFGFSIYCDVPYAVNNVMWL